MSLMMQTSTAGYSNPKNYILNMYAVKQLKQ